MTQGPQFTGYCFQCGEAILANYQLPVEPLCFSCVDKLHTCHAGGKPLSDFIE